MQTLKLSFSLLDAIHPQMHRHVSSNDSDWEVVIELPVRGQPHNGSNPAPGTSMSTEDEYVLGGYAGI
ncbi:hypothetical protein [Dyella sp.]|uniref:hypothetical protein n=1 Tax=Dyella sp. TaxID=1869338 RepID=UPI002D796FB6|nr:hypothetical protein [Dyella sp.]HET7332131.1 hypothetical protein [Dyella sp.]